MLDTENVLLMNTYNYNTEKKWYDNYALCIYNLQTNKRHQIEMDFGKGILLSYFSSTVLIENKKDKIAVAHPTLPFIYIYNNKLETIDTVYVQFQDNISVDSVINTVFSDSLLELNSNRPKEIIQIIKDGNIDQMERIEKVFWLSYDILGYTICKPLSKERMFVFYSISQKKELHRNTYYGAPYNFFSSTRILIDNNKTIWYEPIYKDDKSDMYYQFRIYDLLPFDGAK